MTRCEANTSTGRRCQRPASYLTAGRCWQHGRFNSYPDRADLIDPATVNTHPTAALEIRVAALEITITRLAAAFTPPDSVYDDIINLDDAFADTDDLPIVFD